jgi:transcriptional regulator with XRE-family HTH domain
MSKELPVGTTSEDRRVGATLRNFRQMRGFKPDQFASEIGISRPYLANIEAGRRPLSDVLLARAAEVLRVEQIAIMIPAALPSEVA